jgi:hypothetical protein
MRPADQQDLLRFVPVRAAVGRADLLPYDNERLYSARVETGVRTLIVDGDPGVEFEGSNSEHFFLNFALQPSGRVRYGYSVDVKTENQFEGLDLKSYQLVYLCNVFTLSDERIKSLEKWVDDGGGLVVALGDQSVNAEFYNERFFKEGKGLMPIKLGDLMGDETQEKWAQMVIADPSHRVLRKFNSPELLPLLTGVKFFQWRGIKETGGDDSAEVVQAPGVQVPVRLNDPDGSPLIVEMPWGASGGRVLLLTSTLDGDWTDWPADPMYVVFVQEVSRYLMRTAVDRSNLTVGEPIRYRLDPSRVNNQPQVIYHPTQEDAKPEPTTLQIAPNEATQELWVDYRQTFRAGRYELKLFGKGSAAESETESLWYAVHVDADEGVLARADLAKLSTELEGTATIENDFTTSADAGAKTEIWPYLLVVLGLVLGLEQFLGWRFGKKR